MEPPAKATEPLLPTPTAPSTSDKTIEKPKRTRNQKKPAPVETIVSGKVTFKVDPTQVALLSITPGPIISFRSKPDGFELLSSVKWRDESQAVRHSYATAAGRGGSRAALERMAAAERRGESVAE